MSSYFPTIGMVEFGDFCKMCQMLDNKYLNTSSVDRLFYATNFEIVDLADNPDTSLCRYEFFEIIVRLAMCKYQGLNLRPVEQLNKLLVEHIFKYAISSTA